MPDGPPTTGTGQPRTIVELRGFLPRYAKEAPKSCRAIATSLLEHCLWYFVRDEGVPRIQVRDNEEAIDLDALYDEHMHANAVREAFVVGEHRFELVHVKFRASLNKSNTLNYCAAGRLVKTEGLKGLIPGLTNSMLDDRGEFTYAAYLTSPYLDENVVEQRFAFAISDENDGLALGDVSFSQLREEVGARVQHFLAESLQRNIRASAQRIDDFVQRRAPRYRTILKYVEGDEVFVDPNISDKDLDLVLHRQVFKVEERVLREGHDILSVKSDESYADYQERVATYLERVSDLKKSDLVNYVTHRKIVIDLLQAAIQHDQNARFAREDRIHGLIAPMRRTSDGYEFRHENLWLIDERLAFHNYLASDLPIASMPISADDSGKEPDIVSLRLFDVPMLVAENSGPPASLTVVEFKKPMRNNYRPGLSEEHDPILQALDYLARLRNGTATRLGRPIPNADRIPGFVYVVADLTDKLRRSCEIYNLTRAPDGLGYFGYNGQPNVNAYIQVISFDSLVQGARERNRAFFDTLGLPAT